ncbi:MAG: 30S ribosome-binding factor RbfA [Alphaproteobacteria bacterium]|nr:30S ribosome-binding factor RbfA [Alphaproteobacteria bacterium]
MSHKPSGPTQRQLRVGEQLRHIIAETLIRGHFHDPVLLDAGKITVSEVRVAPDLKNATAYVMSLGGEDMDAIIPALNDCAPYFQGEINRKTEMKFTPKLKFKIDDSFEKVQRLDSILNNLTYSKEN